MGRRFASCNRCSCSSTKSKENGRRLDGYALRGRSEGKAFVQRGSRDFDLAVIGNFLPNDEHSRAMARIMAARKRMRGKSRIGSAFTTAVAFVFASKVCNDETKIFVCGIAWQYSSSSGLFPTLRPLCLSINVQRARRLLDVQCLLSSTGELFC